MGHIGLCRRSHMAVRSIRSSPVDRLFKKDILQKAVQVMDTRTTPSYRLQPTNIKTSRMILHMYPTFYFETIYTMVGFSGRQAVSASPTSPLSITFIPVHSRAVWLIHPSKDPPLPNTKSQFLVRILETYGGTVQLTLQTLGISYARLWPRLRRIKRVHTAQVEAARADCYYTHTSLGQNLGGWKDPTQAWIRYLRHPLPSHTSQRPSSTQTFPERLPREEPGK